MNDVQSIHQTYNRNYLQAEYNFAVASAASARRWIEVEKDAEAVRRAVQATAKDTKGIFRFNPGKQRKTFPDYNPYTISRCRDCDRVKGKMKLSRSVDNEVCEACQLCHKCWNDKTEKENRKRIENNRKLYDRLSKDKRYKDVEFNPENGALKAIHIRHNEGKGEGLMLEKKLVDELYRCGHCIILCDEQKKGRDGNVLPSLDMILDGVRMDIKSITKDKPFYGSAIKEKK